MRNNTAAQRCSAVTGYAVWMFSIWSCKTWYSQLVECLSAPSVCYDTSLQQFCFAPSWSSSFPLPLWKATINQKYSVTDTHPAQSCHISSWLLNTLAKNEEVMGGWERGGAWGGVVAVNAGNAGDTDRVGARSSVEALKCCTSGTV